MRFVRRNTRTVEAVTHLSATAAAKVRENASKPRRQALLAALRTAGLDPQALAVGGAFTAVVVGLAAQNTLGNVLAGVLLLTARPFRVGDRVRFQAGGLAGQIEGVVMSLGLLYVTLAQGEDTIMIPNNVAMAAAVVPLREPAAVDLRARLKPEAKPSELQQFLEQNA